MTDNTPLDPLDAQVQARLEEIRQRLARAQRDLYNHPVDAMNLVDNDVEYLLTLVSALQEENGVLRKHLEYFAYMSGISHDNRYYIPAGRIMAAREALGIAEEGDTKP